MGEIKNMGILTNTPNIYDAVDYRVPDNTSLIYDDKYQGGEAVSCSKPDTTIFDTGIIEAGTFAGTYGLGFYYDSSTATVQGTPLMRFEVYEDGELMEENIVDYGSWTIYGYDLNFMNYAYLYGLHDTKVFKASSSYQIIVKTADTLTNDAILDYVTLARIGDTCGIDGRPPMVMLSGRNAGNTTNMSDYGTQFVIEMNSGYILNGSIAADATISLDFNYLTPFKTVVGVWVTVIDSSGKIWGSYLSTDYTNNSITIIFRNVSNSYWSSQSTVVHMLMVGYI